MIRFAAPTPPLTSSRLAGGLAACALLAVALLGGCSRADTDATLRLGTNVWPGYEPLFLARKQGYWSDGQIRLVEYPSATEVLRAFRNRSIEAASLTLDEVMRLREDDIPVQVVLVHDISAGADVVLARPGIGGMADLRGRRVGVESSALGAFMLTRALELSGLRLDEIETLSVDINGHERAYLSGAVDAVVTFEPVRTRLLNAGAREIFTSRELPNEIVDVLVVHERFARRHPERVQLLVDAWFQALALMEQDRNSAAHVFAERLKTTPGEVLASFEGLRLPSRAENLALLGGEQAALQATAEHLGRVMSAARLLRAPLEARSLFNSAFVQGAAP
ncbi:MAG: ABC transporter substrate-binding protein [Gammaproteobacteria bacterium]